MKIGYYPGCSLHGTARELDESLRAVAAPLDLELEEVEDWSCCGASSAHAVGGHELAVALPARNLALAAEQGYDQVLAPCAACYNRLANARHALASDAGLAAAIERLLGRPVPSGVTARNLVEVLHERRAAIRALVARPLAGLRVACYYGCLLVRPAAVLGFDDAEAPLAFEEVVQALGATAVRWNRRLDCCGGAFSVARTGSVIRLSRAILEDARAAGAEAIAVACPMCHSNLDFRQSAMRRRGEAALPVFYLSELVGLALGVPPQRLGLQRHFVDSRPLVARLTADEAGPGTATSESRAAEVH